jgi:hypothetical protein
MEQDRKTEIVTEQIADALQDLKRKYGQEIVFSLNADYQKGKIIVRVEA